MVVIVSWIGLMRCLGAGSSDFFERAVRTAVVARVVLRATFWVVLGMVSAREKRLLTFILTFILFGKTAGKSHGY